MELKPHTLEEIRKRLDRGEFPLAGTTELGSAEFHFDKPSYFAGIAVHNGHCVRPDLLDLMVVSEADRLREEDPYTDRFIADMPIRIIARDSRFEYDINRSKDQAVYLTPEMAWGLDVLKRDLTPAEKERALRKFDEFQALMDIVTDYLLSRNHHALIFDMHSFCYRRDDQTLTRQNDPKPEINVGDAHANREIFGSVMDDFLSRLKTITLEGEPITVAENDLFKGGGLARRLLQTHHDRLLILSVEFKKIFMDEWTGEVFEDMLDALCRQYMEAAMATARHPVFTNPACELRFAFAREPL